MFQNFHNINPVTRSRPNNAKNFQGKKTTSHRSDGRKKINQNLWHLLYIHDKQSFGSEYVKRRETIALKYEEQ
jgi:hypothetical protein